MTSSTLAASTAVLSEYNFFPMIDKSGSMSYPVREGSTVRRWNAVQESALSLVKDLEKIDDDGLDVILFGGTGTAGVKSFEGVTSDKVMDIFATTEPRGGTPLAEALEEALRLAAKSSKKAFIPIWTDGIPDDPDAVKKLIIDAANALQSDDQLTILFIQVGNDLGATEYLASLDDELKEARFDIVDTKSQAEADAFASTTDLILAAIAG